LWDDQGVPADFPQRPSGLVSAQCHQGFAYRQKIQLFALGLTPPSLRNPAPQPESQKEKQESQETGN
jgi:hypothetical protein